MKKKQYLAPGRVSWELTAEQLMASSSIQFGEDGSGSAAIFEDEYNGEGLVKESMNEWNW